MTRILITGTNGQVGFELKRALATLGEVLAMDRKQMDLAQADVIHSVLTQFKPDIIVNPAAYTAVDRAEAEPEMAAAVNTNAPAQLAAWAGQHNALLVHYSTDYVFDGTKVGAYVEGDTANPQSVYGMSKWLGEEAIRRATAHHLILRTSWVVGAYGSNFMKTMLRLAKERSSLSVVADQMGAPTPASLIADVTAQVISHYLRNPQDFSYGTYHLTSSGSTSWHGYAQYLLELAEAAGVAMATKASDIKPIPTSGYPLPAKRPSNSVMDSGKLQHEFGLSMPDWQSGIAHIFHLLNQ